MEVGFYKRDQIKKNNDQTQDKEMLLKAVCRSQPLIPVREKRKKHGGFQNPKPAKRNLVMSAEILDGISGPIVRQR